MLECSAWPIHQNQPSSLLENHYYMITFWTSIKGYFHFFRHRKESDHALYLNFLAIPAGQIHNLFLNVIKYNFFISIIQLYWIHDKVLNMKLHIITRLDQYQLNRSKSFKCGQNKQNRQSFWERKPPFWWHSKSSTVFCCRCFSDVL